MTQKIRQVEDVEGRAYQLERCLGGGGQGTVYAVKGERLAVKVLEGANSDERRERLRQQLESVRRAKLDDVPIARPLIMLRSHVGYVMEMMNDMESAFELMSPPTSARSPLQWYLDSGGLGRRLRLLGRCALALGQLHGKGLVYVDLSPNNVFVSSDPKYEELYLIDADNLCHQSSPGLGNVYTPGYGAPEIVSGKGSANSLTDAFSFAILAFQMLALVHPFDGDFVNEGPPELMEEAWAGKHPWIDHPQDMYNRTDRGVSRDHVLSPRLKKLAAKTFERGLHDPLVRPSVMEWAERLFTAADVTLKCPKCTGSYYYSQGECPWCGTSTPDYVMLRVRHVTPEEQINELREKKVIGGLTFVIPGKAELTRRVTAGCAGYESHLPSIEVDVRWLNSRIFVRNIDGGEYTMVSPDGKRRATVSGRFKAYSPDWSLHLGPLDRPHRVITFEIRKAGRRERR